MDIARCKMDKKGRINLPATFLATDAADFLPIFLAIFAFPCIAIS